MACLLPAPAAAHVCSRASRTRPGGFSSVAQTYASRSAPSRCWPRAALALGVGDCLPGAVLPSHERQATPRGVRGHLWRGRFAWQAPGGQRCIAAGAGGNGSGGSGGGDAVPPAAAAAPASAPPSTAAASPSPSSTSALSSSASPSAPSAGAAPAGHGQEALPARLLRSVRRVVSEQYLPLMLLTALAAAALKPSWGLAASKTDLQSVITFTIFVLQGMMLRRGEAEKALGAVGAITWGLAAILLITPLTAPLAGALPLQPPGLALGLLVFACMPTTLSAGVALTQVLGGNTALALLLTISSNLTAVFTLPFLLPWALKTTAALGGFGAASAAASATAAAAGGGAAAAVRLDPIPLLVQLVQCILLPTLAGASVRGVLPGLRTWVDANRRVLSVTSGGLLSLVPWMQVSKALAQGVVVAPSALAAAVAGSLSFHAAYLLLNTVVATAFKLGGADPAAAAPTRRALIIVASQKTLPVAMAVLGRLAPVVGPEAAGCAAVSAVFSHLAQTCVDFALLPRWLEQVRVWEEAGARKARDHGPPSAPASAG